jgi:predicted glutamine amidotransferase
MCIIIYKPEGVVVPEKIFQKWLTNGESGNKDGAGIAVKVGKRVVWEKGFFKLADTISVAGKYNVAKCALVVHFRTGTSGGQGKELTHPFLISPKRSHKLLAGELANNEALIFHNGILSGTGVTYQYYTTRAESDTSTVAENLKAYGKTIATNPKLLTGILNAVEASQKFLVMSNFGISLTDNFIEENGVFFSNSAYKSSIASVRTIPYRYEFYDPFRKGSIPERKYTYSDKFTYEKIETD